MWKSCQNTVNSPTEMKEFAKRIAVASKRGTIVTLRGDLGVGKTVFARGFIQALLKDNTEVLSPTFTILQTYDANIEIRHYDLYRLENMIEADEIGIEEGFDSAITLIEWPEIIERILPKDKLDITILYGNKKNERIIKTRIVE